MSNKPIYVKFLYPEDIYIIDPLYDEVEGRPNSKVCGKCGNTIHIPVYGPETLEASQNLGEVFVPHPKDYPEYRIYGEPQLPILRCYREMDFAEEQTLIRKNRGNIILINKGWIEMIVADFSPEPKACEVCFPEPQEDLCRSES